MPRSSHHHAQGNRLEFGALFETVNAYGLEFIAENDSDYESIARVGSSLENMASASSCLPANAPSTFPQLSRRKIRFPVTSNLDPRCKKFTLEVVSDTSREMIGTNFHRAVAASWRTMEAKSFMLKNLRVSHLNSIICGYKSAPLAHKLFEIKIMAESEQKMNGGTPRQPSLIWHTVLEQDLDACDQAWNLLILFHGGPKYSPCVGRGSLFAASRISSCFPLNFCLLCRLSHSPSVYLYPSHTMRVPTLPAILCQRNFQTCPGFQQL